MFPSQKSISYRRVAVILELMFYLILLFAGCASVTFNESIMAREVTFKMVREDPAAYKGTTILWAGAIIGVVNIEGETFLEVFHIPSNSQGRSKDVDESDGRFLAMYTDCLDVAIYRPGKEVTVSGRVQDMRKLPVGNCEYSYPLIAAEEIRLWKARKRVRVYPYPDWYRPWWWYEQYWWDLW